MGLAWILFRKLFKKQRSTLFSSSREIQNNDLLILFFNNTYFNFRMRLLIAFLASAFAQVEEEVNDVRFGELKKVRSHLTGKITFE
jgi:hypothetical protein